ncbi:MAG: MBL fold metallo-hydrolase [Methylovirgula sp.]|uniref:MBL fold metallo-hydrolase n=1 Tax=Methylovirgula sp. TaxID=1978224 RepID=UPI003075FF2D
MTLPNNSISADRRDVICSGGAFAFSSFISLLFSTSETVRAAALQAKPPEIDQLSVRIVTDSYQMAVAPNLKVGNLEIKRFGFAIGDHPPEKAILSEFGLSLHATSQIGSDSRRVLIDFGYTPQTLLNNFDLLGLDPGSIDALVLSHGHYDHFGGLVGFLDHSKGRLKPKLPIFLGGEECFCARQWVAPPMKGDFGALNRDAIEKANLSIMFAPGPAVVADHGFTTGRIELTSFEKVLSPSKMKIGRTGSFGCYPEDFTQDERDKGIIPDQFRHEIATAFNLKGRGLIILTSCSHRGLVNTIKQAQGASGVEKIHAIVGGFHLAPQKEESSVKKASQAVS